MFEYIKDQLDPPIKDHRIFFLHIAKCGGTSISNAIVKCYKPWRPGNIHTVVNLNEEAARFAEQHAVASYRLVRRDLLNYMMALPNVKCVSGHFQYSNAAHEIFQDQWHFVTVLRDPVTRWLSHYRFNSAKGRLAMPIEEFIETKQGQSFGRAFVDEITEDLDKNTLGIDALISIALSRYRKFSVIGTIEDTWGFAQKFEERFHQKLRIPHLNRTPGSHGQDDVPTKILQRITDLCAPDIKLHNELFPKNHSA
jgi:hypothetical protein